MSIFGSTLNIDNFKNWQTAFRYFLRFAAAKAAVSYGMPIMTTIFAICNGAVARIGSSLDGITGAAVALPSEISTAIEGVGFLASIPLWLVTLIGCLLIWVLSILMILTVYGRFFKLFLFTAISPLPLSTFAGESTSSVGKAFIKSYVGVCLEGAVIVICCIIFSAYITAFDPGAIDTTAPAVNLVWSYLGEVIFNMLILVGLVKGSDRVVKEMMGL